MKETVSARIMRESDAYTAENITDSRLLMYRAGEGIFRSYAFSGRVAIICGTGNNAGDGYVLALLLNERDIDVTLFLSAEKFSPDGKFYFDKCTEKGIKTRLCSADTVFGDYDILVDCIFGTGFRGAIGGPCSDIIDKINESGKIVISADINSGLGADSGLAEKCVRSTLTVSIGTYKHGHFLGMAKDVIGAKTNVDIGINIRGERAFLFEKEDAAPLLAKRRSFANKGSYGYVGIMGGCNEYSGAVKLANLSSSALRAGCGVARLIVPRSISHGVMPYLLESTLCPLDDIGGHMIFCENAVDSALGGLAALALGMGWGASEDNEKILSYILENYSIPLVIDADGLNTLAKMDKDILRHTKCKVVLTPHPKEFERISGVPVREALDAPVDSAVRFARDNGVILLLKGTATVVTNGADTYIIDRGCAGMASAGSGDVLSGILAGLLGYMEYSPRTVALGAFIAGVAGEVAEEALTDIAMTAGDTAKHIPTAIKRIRV